jgi:5-methylcytosine-specific restriction endonuclease McrA
MDEILVCSKCGKKKPSSEFYKTKNPKSRKGYWSHCKKCTQEHRKTRRSLDRVHNSENNKVYRDKLTDYWVRKNIYIQSKGQIKWGDVTPKMIEERRERILLKRILREGTPATVKEKGPYLKECEVCKCLFISKVKNGKVCSVACRVEYRRRLSFSQNVKKSNRIGDRICPECGEVFFIIYGDKRRAFCSKECSYKVSRRIGRSSRRAKFKEADYENIDPLEILTRDNWICQICGVPTPYSKRGTVEDDAPELDHIIPISKGGGHTRANTQCLCRKCNHKKSDSLSF